LSVLMISPQFRPLVGGYERAAERLSLELVRGGHSVTVATERVDRSWPAREDLGGVTIRRLWCIYRRGLHVATAMASLGWFLLWRGRRFDVWHVHQYREAAVVAVLMGRLLSRPVVLKVTSSGEGGIARLIADTRMPKLAAWALRNVDACVAVSRETETEAAAFGIPKDRVYLIGNGVDVKSFHPAEDDAERRRLRGELGLDEGHVAISVGRFSEEKNPLGLLEAWAAAKASDHAGEAAAAWTLALLGDGALRDDVRAAVERLGLERSVVLAGHRDDVDRWLQASDVYVLTSHREGLSNTTMEAMATGLPVVVTAVSGMSELVEDPEAGVVVPTGDAGALADALLGLMSNAADRESMGRRGRAVIVERYSIESVAEQHVTMYRSVMRSG
jgi:glycosyltransferase involved in cell wall biosynthesis